MQFRALKPIVHAFGINLGITHLALHGLYSPKLPRTATIHYISQAQL